MESKASILVVDDEPDNLDVIEMLLASEGHALNYASSGFEALSYLEHSQPDVILLDVMMPGMNGIALCQKIRSNPLLQHIPIIVVTALNAKEDIARCLDAGADDFISKPVQGIELRARVRSMLRIGQQYKALKATLQTREDMSNMIVHDLRNPLSSIMLACTVLRMLELSERQQKKVEQISIAGQQLQSMIDSLLVMAKLEAGKLLLNPTLIDLQKLGKDSIFELAAIAAQKEIELVSELPQAGVEIKADALILRRVLDNLLANAIKFSPSRSQVRLEIDRPAGLNARIKVADNGPGIDAKLQKTIFEKFEIGDQQPEVDQIGLGLAFCKLAIAAHGGRISVQDNSPRGSVFTVEL